MSSRLELLEKLVNRSALSTQRATHTNIISIGGGVLNDVEDSRDARYKRDLKDALDAAASQAEIDKRRALLQLKRQMDIEREKALELQKLHFEQLAKSVGEMRDRLEEERINELTKKLNKERDDALNLQWEEALRQKAQAIKDACEALTVKLGREHRLDKEMSIAAALKHARDKFKEALAKTIEETTRKCHEVSAQEAARVAQLHAEEMQRRDIRYQELKDKYTTEHAHRLKVDQDFLELQTDYQRFMDYTDGKFHSDYMMSLRRHGMKLSEKRLSDVSEYQERPLSAIILPSRLSKKL